MANKVPATKHHQKQCKRCTQQCTHVSFNTTNLVALRPSYVPKLNSINQWCHWLELQPHALTRQESEHAHSAFGALPCLHSFYLFLACARAWSSFSNMFRRRRFSAKSLQRISMRSSKILCADAILSYFDYCSQFRLLLSECVFSSLPTICNVPIS